MAYTYPAPAPTLSADLTAVQVHHLLKSPGIIARRLRTLALQKFIADFLLTDKYKAVGGAILYPNGEPLFTNDDPEAVGIGGEYPLTSLDSGTLAMAKTVKWGRDVEVFDEAIARLLMSPVDRALNRLVNTMVRYVDSVALGVIASKIVRTKAAGAAWTALTSGEQIVEDVGLAVADTEELEDGFAIDTVVLKPTQYAKVRARLIAADLLPRETGNPLTDGTATGVFDYMGLSWATSIHSPVTDPLLLDRQQLGGMADEDLKSPGYTGAEGGIEVKSMRKDETDGYRLRSRRVTVPVVVEPNAGVRLTGTGL